MSRVRRIVLVPLAAVAMVAGITAVPTRACAETSAEIQSQLDDANAKLDDLYSQAEQASENLNETKVQLEKTQAQVDQLQAQIDQLQAQIDATQAKIDQKQAELEQVQKVLSGRVSSNYKAGNASELEVLLSSTSFDDLVSRIYYADKVSDHDAQMIQDVKDIKTELQTEKDSLDQQNSQLESQKEQLVEQRDQQASLLEKQKSQQADLDAQSKQAENYVNSLSDALKQKIAEEQAAAAEAARKAAAAAAASSGGYSVIGNDSYSGGPLSDSTRQAIIAAAYTQLGLPYVWGGYSVNTCFDCSGLTKYCYSTVGINIDHSSWSQKNFCTKSASEAVPGDVVWKTGHVGLYIGNGQVIEAVPPCSRIGTLADFTLSGSPY